jgi:hypothetical protein
VLQDAEARAARRLIKALKAETARLCEVVK